MHTSNHFCSSTRKAHSGGTMVLSRFLAATLATIDISTYHAIRSFDTSLLPVTFH